MRHWLWTFPILRRSYDNYYADHAKYVAKQKPEVEKQWGKSFKELRHAVQVQWEEQWFWPPWIHNDVVGYLMIGSDGGSYLGGDVYLMRKCFPQEARERAYRKYDSVLRKREILYYREIPKIQVGLGNNRSYVAAAMKIVKTARQVIRQRIRTAVIRLSTYDLDCLNMAEADRQAREREEFSK